MKRRKTKKKVDLLSGSRKPLSVAPYENNYSNAGYTIDFLALRGWMQATEWQLDKIDRALRTLASWNETGEWSGALAYVNAILDETQQSKSEGNDNENT